MRTWSLSHSTRQALILTTPQQAHTCSVKCTNTRARTNKRMDERYKHIISLLHDDNNIPPLRTIKTPGLGLAQLDPIYTMEFLCSYLTRRSQIWEVRYETENHAWTQWYPNQTTFLSHRSYTCKQIGRAFTCISSIKSVTSNPNICHKNINEFFMRKNCRGFPFEKNEIQFTKRFFIALGLKF